MKFASTSELNQQTNNVLNQVVDQGEDVILTKNGKPIAIISPMSEDELESHILIKHFGIDKAPSIKERKDALPADEAFERIKKQIAHTEES